MPSSRPTDATIALIEHLPGFEFAHETSQFVRVIGPDTCTQASAVGYITPEEILA